MSNYWALPLAAAIAESLICLGLIRRIRTDRASRVVAAVILTIVAWNLDLFCLYHLKDAETAERWSTLFRVGLLFSPPTLFHYGLVIGEYRGRPGKILLAFGYCVATFLAILNLTGHLTVHLVERSWGWDPQLTRWYGLFVLSMVVYVCLLMVLLGMRFRRPSSPRQLVQTKFIFVATLVQVPFALTNFLALYGWPIYPLGSVGNMIWVGILAYATTRHRLIDLDYVFRKSLSFVLAATPVLGPGGVALLALGDALGAEAPALLSTAAIALALIAVLLVPTLQEAIETRVDRAFFPDRYGSRQRLRGLAATLVHILDQRALVERLGAELGDVLDLETVEIFMADEQGKRLTLAFPEPDTPEALPDSLLQGLDHIERATLTSELEAARNPLTVLFHAQGWEVGIPLHINQHLMGFVGLGSRRDLRIYSAEDLLLLDSVAAGASVALENTKLSRQLRRSEAVLERANRLSSVGMLAAGIAHEIRNPLVAVKTFLDLLPNRLDDREFLTKFRDLSLSELRRVTDLISGLLSFGKSTKAERRAVEVAETLEPVVRLMQSTAKKRGIDLSSNLSTNLPALWADPDQLKQIVLNLLLNAIEASATDTHVRLSALRADGRVWLAVSDEGPGIPKEQLDDIFHPFFTTKETGTGLGLALVHQMVIDHGGEITVESQVGRGTTFRVALPTAQAVNQTGSNAGVGAVTSRAAASSSAAPGT